MLSYVVFFKQAMCYCVCFILGSSDHKPKEMLPISGTKFEDQVASLVQDVFEPEGFQVMSWSRVPYLCEGDLRQSYYWLDDAIFVLKACH